MELIADGLLIATAMTAGLYCLVLSKRLRRLTDSGNGIGPQIEALDQALGDTRAALAETREGVSELRGSTKAAIAQLARETARGEEMADLIQRGVEEAKATLQRLYEAGDRIEAHENRPAKVDRVGENNQDDHDNTGAGEDAPGIETQPVAGDYPPTDWTDDGVEPAGESGAGDSATGPKDALTEGEVVEPEAEAAEAEAEAEAEAVSAASSGTASERTGSVLKAERVML